MGISRSSYSERLCLRTTIPRSSSPSRPICEEFENYGWRRARTELRHRGVIVNHEKIRRLMREHDLQPRRRGRHVTNSDSDHEEPIYLNRTQDLVGRRPILFSNGSRATARSRALYDVVGCLCSLRAHKALDGGQLGAEWLG